MEFEINLRKIYNKKLDLVYVIMYNYVKALTVLIQQVMLIILTTLIK